MTSPSLTHCAETFRQTVEASNFPLAEAALQSYIVCFRSQSRTLQEVECARNLLQWSILATQLHKAQLSDALMQLRRVFQAYGKVNRSFTWGVEG